MTKVNRSFFALCMIVLLFSCKESQEASDRPQVIATTSILADVAQNICSDFADVQSLMGPGVDPHLYKASHSDIKLLSKADVILYNGLHLEGKMSDIFKNWNPNGLLWDFAMEYRKTTFA